MDGVSRGWCSTVNHSWKNPELQAIDNNVKYEVLYSVVCSYLCILKLCMYFSVQLIALYPAFQRCITCQHQDRIMKNERGHWNFVDNDGLCQLAVE